MVPGGFLFRGFEESIPASEVDQAPRVAIRDPDHARTDSGCEFIAPEASLGQGFGNPVQEGNNGAGLRRDHGP